MGSSGGRQGTGTRRCSGSLLRLGSGFTFFGIEVERPQHLPCSYLPSANARGTYALFRSSFFGTRLWICTAFSVLWEYMSLSADCRASRRLMPTSSWP